MRNVIVNNKLEYIMNKESLSNAIREILFAMQEDKSMYFTLSDIACGIVSCLIKKPLSTSEFNVLCINIGQQLSIMQTVTTKITSTTFVKIVKSKELIESTLTLEMFDIKREKSYGYRIEEISTAKNTPRMMMKVSNDMNGHMEFDDIKHSLPYLDDQEVIAILAETRMCLRTNLKINNNKMIISNRGNRSNLSH